MGGKKKKGGKDKGESREPVAAKTEIIEVDTEKWMKLNFKLLNWKYMDFTMTFKETARVFTLKKILSQRHGHTKDMKLCQNSFTEINEMTDEMLSLSEYGLKGEPREIKIRIDGVREIDESHIPIYQIYYDFKPADTGGDPVILFHK